MKDPLIRAHYKGCWYYFGPFESREEAQQLEARIKSAWIDPHIQHLPINDPKDCLGVAMPGTSATHNMPPCECHKDVHFLFTNSLEAKIAAGQYVRRSRKAGWHDKFSIENGGLRVDKRPGPHLSY